MQITEALSPRTGEWGGWPGVGWGGGGGEWAAAVLSWCSVKKWLQPLLQVTLLLGASQDLLPQLKQQHDMDTLDMVFLDH